MEKYKLNTKTEKILRRNRKLWSKKGLIALLTYTLALLLLGIIGKSCWDSYWRGHSWKFQSPVIFQNPLIIKDIDPQATIPLITPQNAPEGAITKQNEYPSEWEEAYKLVRLHESSNGRPTGLNGHCISQGQLNQIGFAPYQSYCFKDEADQKATFMLWVKNRLGIPCVKVGFCRANMHDLLLLYTNNSYTL